MRAPLSKDSEAAGLALQKLYDSADSANATPSSQGSWRPGGDSNPRSVPASRRRDVENRSLFSVKAQGRDQAIQSPEIPCTHHFLLPTPSGPTVEGVCKKCGAIRTYQSYYDGNAGMWREYAEGGMNPVKGMAVWI